MNDETRNSMEAFLTRFTGPDAERTKDAFRLTAEILDQAERNGEAKIYDHKQWAKDRALDLVRDGDLRGAMMSLLSDFKKHEVFPRGHLAYTLILDHADNVADIDANQAEAFIKGF